MFLHEDIFGDGSGVMMYSGNKVEKVCELAHITLNKNAVFGDSSALAPGGVRIGMVPFPLVVSSAVVWWSLFEWQLDCGEKVVGSLICGVCPYKQGKSHP